MNISQIAKKSGLSAKQIRDYEKIGLLGKPLRSDNGYRFYRESDIERLQFIAQARQVDFSLAEIKELLELQDDPQRTSREVKHITSQHIARLYQEIAQIQQVLSMLESWHSACKGDDDSACPILSGLNSRGCLQQSPPHSKSSPR